MSDTCPVCHRSTLLHAWRADMRTLKWVDTYTCITCGERWTEYGTPDFIEETDDAAQ